MKIGVKFKPRNLWIGAYWKRWNVTKVKGWTRKTSGISDNDLKELDIEQGVEQFDIYICLIPCFPIHVTIQAKG